MASSPLALLSMKRIVILGSTGKIGQKALEVVRNNPRDFKVVGLSTFKNKELLEKQIKEFKPGKVVIGEKGLEELVGSVDVDLVVIAVVGLAGLEPTLTALDKGIDVALATKEVLVLAGSLVCQKAKEKKVNVIPIDSEHSALFQCLKSGKKEEIKRLLLTVGKGPIAKMAKKDLVKVTVADIFNRSAWSLGQKIGIDSATGINKSFEVIEAHHLFEVSQEEISLVVHPEYLCHSLVEFIDGSIIGEFGTPDMYRYLQYALFYPERKPTLPSFFCDLAGKNLSFEKPDFDKFPGLSLGHKALMAGGTMPAVLHGADSTAVNLFLSGKINFVQIARIIEETMNQHKAIKDPALAEILKAEKWAQNRAGEIWEKKLR